MKKAVLAVSLIAVLALSGCSTTPADGSTESSGDSNVTSALLNSTTLSESLQRVNSDETENQFPRESKPNATKPQTKTTLTTKPASKPSVIPKVTEGKPASVTKPASYATPSQINALRSAKSYLNYSNFSYDGLIDQLEYEKYSHDDAVYAANHCGADWDKQALGAAHSYLNYSAFSYSGLVSQLKHDKFTAAQATYAADRCGADWNEQAAKKAKSYLEYSAFSRDGLIAQLEYEGFSHEQAVYGAEANGL